MPESVDVVVVGSVNRDLVIEVDALPAPGETVRGGPAVRLGGGKGANQAVAVARLGRSVALVGAVGTDGDSEALRAELAAEAGDVGRLAAVDGPPGHAVVLVDRRAENCIVVSPGANARVGVAAVEAAGALRTAAAVVVAQLEIPAAAVVAAARLARGTFVLNPAPAPSSAAELPQELWSLVDVLVPNRGELARLCGVAEASLAGAELARSAAGLPCERVVVTLGAEGALVRDGEQVELIPAPAVRAADTTGAGDTFCGALAVGLAEGRTLTEAARFAVRAAAVSVTRTGARTAMPTRAQLAAGSAGSAGSVEGVDR
ncbi:ribokinase [Kitasatospora nipponensis]